MIIINKINKKILFSVKKQINFNNINNINNINKNTRRELSTFNPRPDDEDNYNLAMGFLLGYFTGIMMYKK
jgi:hypothetical protein